MEILFYHLQNSPLEQTLPSLLEKTLQRGWKAVVRASSDERLKALDDHLWTFSDDGFLPHARVGDADQEAHPIILSLTDIRYNNAEVMFAVDGADLPQTDGWSRAVLIFDNKDDKALQKARLAWKTVKAQNHEATYWRQNDAGRWEKQA